MGEVIPQHIIEQQERVLFPKYSFLFQQSGYYNYPMKPF